MKQEIASIDNEKYNYADYRIIYIWNKSSWFCRESGFSNSVVELLNGQERSIPKEVVVGVNLVWQHKVIAVDFFLNIHRLIKINI